MTEDLIFTQEGPIGLITLNRPKALNALNLAMIKGMHHQLSQWKDDDAVKAVVIQAVAGTAFCAGGDVRWLYELGAMQVERQMEFFWHEYRLNHFIHHLGKPYIALMDGITMGGGVGIALHGSHPIASERMSFAMPETSIGFFPDIGASYLLTQCPNSLGIYLGLTGNRLTASEAKEAGIVKAVVATEAVPLLLDALIHSDLSKDVSLRIDACIAQYMQKNMNSVSDKQELIDECFSLNSMEAIISALERHPSDKAKTIADTLANKSPFSLKLTLAQLQKARGLSLADCLRMDYNLVRHFMTSHDFYEGVRALLVDKDKNPQWQPSSLEQVDESRVADYFNPAAELLHFNGV